MLIREQVRPHIVRCLCGTVALALVALIAFGCLFTTFMPWDDEGYFLLSYRDYLQGKAPYDAIYSFYGPYSFIAAGLFTGFQASKVTHDHLRWITFALWVGASGLFAAAVFRYTGDFRIALIEFLAIGMRLCGISRAVGHPQILVIALLPIMLILGTGWLKDSRLVWRGFWTGFTISVILLIKVNIGIYVLLAYALLVCLQLTNIRWRAISVIAIFLFSSSMAIAMMLEKVRGRWERWFVFIFLLSLGAVILTAWFRTPHKASLRPTASIWFFSGFTAAAAIGFGAMLAAGTSPGGLWNVLVIDPLRLARGYHWPFYDASRPDSKMLCAAAALLSAAVLALARLSRRVTAISWLKVLVGGGVLLTTWYNPVAGLCASLLSVWLVLFETPSRPEAFPDRTLAALLAMLYSLQLFPVAGDQIVWATLLPTTIGAVVLADGMRAILNDRALNVRVRGLAPAACILLGGVFAIAASLRGHDLWRQWQSSQQVGLPGASYLRLPKSETARLRLISASMEQNCRAVLNLPGLYSFAVWTGVEPKERRRIDSWPFLFDGDVISRELDRLAGGDCVLISDGTLELFKMLARHPASLEPLQAMRQTMNILADAEDTPIENMPSEGKRITLYQARF